MVDVGSWKTGKLQPKSFPLNSGGIPYGPRCTWRVCRLSVGSNDLRLLVVIHKEKQNYLAVLGEMVDSKLYILSSLESHATHPGLHCHAACDRTMPAFSGSMRYPGVVPRPYDRSRCRRQIVWTERAAWETAARFYRIREAPEDGLI
jgi:hypothetical protein